MGDVSIDLTKVAEEVNKLSPEQLAEKLTKIRTRDKKQQKRNYNSESAKKYQAKAREEKRQMKDAALKLPATILDAVDEEGKPVTFANLWEQINFYADKTAEEELAEESTESED